MPTLGKFLDQLQTHYHEVGYLASDPLEFAHQFTDPWDQEAVALLAALLAYGNVKQIRRSVAGALERMGTVSTGPADFVRTLGDTTALDFQVKAHEAFRGYVHRFNVGEDLLVLFRLLARSWKESGSLGAHFLKYLDPSDRTIGPALNSLVLEWREWALALPRQQRPKASFSYLLTAPKDGSCCKRWCMFLRWMGRRDRLDLGLWGKESPLNATFPKGRWLRTDQLVIPLDTHTGRISQYLELTHRKSLNWLAAVEVTESLRVCDPLDPVRYDFALARLGILDLCQRKYRAEICARCQLFTVCKFAQRKVG